MRSSDVTTLATRNYSGDIDWLTSNSLHKLFKKNKKMDVEQLKYRIVYATSPGSLLSVDWWTTVANTWSMERS